MTMKLFLSGLSPDNSTFRDSGGRELFTTESPSSLLEKTTTISRCALPRDLERDDDKNSLVSTEVAQIKWHPISSSIFQFSDGREVSVDEYLRKAGFLMLNRVFTAPDQRVYTWKMSPTASTLYANDDLDNAVARFNRLSLGVFGEAHEPYLEVFPQGEHILETILITFIYVEQIRGPRERALQRLFRSVYPQKLKESHH